MKRGGENYLNKKGQFYLLAAIIIIVLAIGFFSVTNYTNKKTNSRVDELAEELKTESGKILELGAVDGNYPWDSFTKNFTEYAGSEFEIIYIVGNSSEHEVFKIVDGAKVTTGLGLNDVFVNDVEGNYYLIIIPEEGARKFNFYKGENFYFIITYENNGERYVITNE